MFGTSLRGLILSTVLMLTTLMPALAGDVAEIEIIGFSPEGYSFAFEQFGTSDGSGFPYVEIHFVEVDLIEQGPAAPTLCLEADDEESSLESLRAQARRQAVPTFRKLGLLSATPGRTLYCALPISDAFQPAGEKRVDLLLDGAKTSFQIQETEIAGGESTLMGPGQSLRLEWVDSLSGVRFLLHDDQGKLPAARAGATNYRIVAIVAQGEAMAILVAYQVPSFEGPSIRYMAIAFDR